MALKLTFTDEYNRPAVDSYWKIEDLRISYNANPREGQPASMALIILKGYPNQDWRNEGKQPFPGKQVVQVTDIENLSFSDYDGLRAMCYAIVKNHPFFKDAIDV